MIDEVVVTVVVHGRGGDGGGGVWSRGDGGGGTWSRGDGGGGGVVVGGQHVVVIT